MCTVCVIGAVPDKPIQVQMSQIKAMKAKPTGTMRHSLVGPFLPSEVP